MLYIVKVYVGCIMAITEQITTRLAEILKDVDLATTSGTLHGDAAPCHTRPANTYPAQRDRYENNWPKTWALTTWHPTSPSCASRYAPLGAPPHAHQHQSQQIQDYLASASPAEDEADVEDAPAPQAKCAVVHNPHHQPITASQATARIRPSRWWLWPRALTRVGCHCGAHPHEAHRGGQSPVAVHQGE